MALSPHNDPIRSSDQLIIAIGNRELYLLATLEYVGLIYFPFGATTQSAITAQVSRTLPPLIAQ
jgi:hypothetical protein